MSNWHPWKTHPQDGKRFLAYAKGMDIVNHPPGCALGRWVKRGKEWAGSAIEVEKPTHWMELPKHPKKWR